MHLTLLPLLFLVAAEPTTGPKVPVGKETTYVNGPLDKDGFIDYEAALNERLRKNIVPEKNGAVLMWKVLGPRPDDGRGMPAGYFKQLGSAEPPLNGDYYVKTGRFIKNLKLQQDEIDLFYKQYGNSNKRAWTPEEYPHVAAWLSINEKQLNLVVEASKRPEYFSPFVAHPTADGKRGMLIAVLLPHVQMHREMAPALAARAILRLGEGKEDDAWQDLMACHRLARMTASGPTLIELLVGIAIETVAGNADLVYLERAKLTSKQVGERLKDLESLPPLARPADKVDLGDRLMLLDSLQSLRRHGFGRFEGIIDGPKGLDRPTEQLLLEKIDWAPVYRSANQWYDRLAAAMRLADRGERRKQLDQIDKDAREPKGEVYQELLARLEKAGAVPDKLDGQTIGNELMSSLRCSGRGIQNASERAEQIRNNLYIAFALAAYRIDNRRYPEKLDDLTPKYLATVPGDVFTGRPITYRLLENGYLLYSFGVNGKDDQGHSWDDEPRGDDLRVRMPLPALAQ